MLPLVKGCGNPLKSVDLTLEVAELTCFLLILMRVLVISSVYSPVSKENIDRKRLDWKAF